MANPPKFPLPIEQNYLICLPNTPVFKSPNENTQSLNASIQHTHPTVAQLMQSVDYLLALGEEGDLLSDLLHAYGDPEWDYSILDEGENGEYLVSIPFVKDGNVRAVLQNSYNGEKHYFQWADRAAAQGYVDGIYEGGTLKRWFLVISKMVIFDYYIMQTIDEEFNVWLKNTMKTLDDTEQIRVDCFWLTVIVCESEISIVDGAGIESIHCYEQSYFDCNGDWDIQPGDYLGQDFDWWDDEGNTITLDDDEDDEDEDIPLLDDCQLAMFHAGRMIIKYGLDMTPEELVDLVGCNASDFEEEAWQGLLEDFSIFGEPGNPCEKELLKKYLWEAYQIYINHFTAESFTETRFSGQGLDGWLDCADAFRHAFFNALNAQDVGTAIALEFSNAHECNGTNNDALMDLWNNDVGHTIGEQYPNVGANVIADRVCDKLKVGKMRVLVDDKDPDSEMIKSHHCECN